MSWNLHWTESWRGYLEISLLSFPKFWTSPIKRFRFEFLMAWQWKPAIPKSSFCYVMCSWRRNGKHFSGFKRLTFFHSRIYALDSYENIGGHPGIKTTTVSTNVLIQTFSCSVVRIHHVTREDKGDREGILHTHPIPWVIRLELFLRPQIPRGIKQQPIT